MIVKKKSKVTKGLIAASFLIAIIALITPVNAWHPNRIFFLATGDDLDLPRTKNFIMGNIKSTSVSAVFYQRISDESGEKVYAMMGILTDGLLQTKYYYFFCPIFMVWFINVWLVMGEGLFKTTDTNYDLVYRNWFPITMPNTEGEYVPVPMLMMLSPTAQYCLKDPGEYPPGSLENPVLTDPELHAWVLVAVLWLKHRWAKQWNYRLVLYPI